ncbi:hypothetical protein [Planomicrobium sp. YIM 101495]|uniref:hypothetical protein n=1 Tax=Planomicrobium sp. YIM 101495 TaxID=2665160 RepID=UPI0012B88168|nr:hypothetical protein [Planomicrobium sp. YIM 101495]MTD30117.1 hypothetical protein [Planomicrobium sp. YIM 101495]
MNIYEALKEVSWKKRLYFTWKHDISYNQTKEKETAEEIMDKLQVKSMNEYIKWERTPQYLQLLSLYLESKFANDLEVVYTNTAERAKEEDADEKSIKLLLQIQKEIRSFNKAASNVKPSDSNSFDDLEL